MTKSFLIALAGFAVGLGVTTALVFISPGPQAPNQAAPKLAAKRPLAETPGSEQRLALPDSKPEMEPAPAATPRRTARSAAVKPSPALPTAPAPLAAPSPGPSAQTGPAMPAVKRSDIAAATLPSPAPVDGQSVASASAVVPPSAPPRIALLPNPAPQSAAPEAVAPGTAVDVAEAQRREHMEHENVRLANLSEAPVLPPAPPPLPPAATLLKDPSAVAAPPSEAGVRRGTWQRFAALTPPIEGRAQVAIVLDDMGLSQFRSDRAISLPRPITLAILPYGNHLDGLVARARTAGHEILVHLPMEPTAADADPGPNALLTGLPLAELDRRIATNLLRLDGYVGINNHMGSRFTASEREMRRVMRALQARGLLFLDSLTTGKSTGYRLAREYGVPTVVRDVFLDNDRDPAKIRRQLALTAAMARENGYAIAIGHPYPETLDALEGWLPGLAARGLVLVPISALVKQNVAAQAGRGDG